MTQNGKDAREELRSAIDGLAEDRARTLLAWLRMVNRERRDQAPAKFSPEESVGPLGDLLGMATEVRERGYCRMRLQVDEAWLNPNGVLHGGVVYTLIDYSMGGAVQAGLAEGEHCTSIEVKISYLAPVRQGTVSVETSVIKQGRNIAFTESKAVDESGRLVATATGSMFVFRGEGAQ